jgi:hypothetical protein
LAEVDLTIGWRGATLDACKLMYVQTLLTSSMAMRMANAP